MVLSAALTTSALAATVPPGVQNTNDQVYHQHFKDKSCGLENFIRDSLKKNNGDLAKVREEVAKHFEQKRSRRESRLQKIAQEKGISVQELKTQISKKRQEKLELKAKKLGMSTEELKKQMKIKHQQKMESMARNLGITVEQLKQIMPQHPMEKR